MSRATLTIQPGKPAPGPSSWSGALLLATGLLCTIGPLALRPVAAQGPDEGSEGERQRPRPATTSPPAAPQASSPDVDAFLEAWGAKMASLRSLQLRFRQEKKLKILRRPRVSEGDLVYDSGRLSVHVRNARGELETAILMADGKLRIYYPSLKRVEEMQLAGASGLGAGAGLSVLTGKPEDLRKEHEVTLRREGEEDVLGIVPRAKPAPFARIELRLRDGEVRGYRQVETNGDEARMEVLEATRDAKVSGDRFRLDLPTDVEVVRPGGRPRSPPASGPETPPAHAPEAPPSRSRSAGAASPGR